jgi:hypothetical protein
MKQIELAKKLHTKSFDFRDKYHKNYYVTNEVPHVLHLSFRIAK